MTAPGQPSKSRANQELLNEYDDLAEPLDEQRACRLLPTLTDTAQSSRR
mgnify:FL=1